VAIDPSERELLAQFLGVTVVRVDVDRTLEEERFVQTLQFVLNDLSQPSSLRNKVRRRS
jgi:hypothetical protein